MRATILLGIMALATVTGSHADTIYRKVDANGRVTFSDKSSGSNGEVSLDVNGTAARTSRNAEDAVFSPVFETSQQERSAGKAFIASIPDCKRSMLVTAYHLLGPAGGFPTQMSIADINSNLRKIRLNDLGNRTLAGEVKAENHTPATAYPCCDATNPRTSAGDVAAFVAPEKLARLALPLAILDARKDERVFVLTSIIGKPGAKLRHEAVVTGMKDGYLMYDLIEPDYVIQATSGAPVINAKGQVVAINLGGGPQRAGKVGYFGMGNPVSAWRTPLSQTCAMNAEH